MLENLLHLHFNIMLAYQSNTDVELILLLKKDDVQAFEQIYHRYWKLMFSIAISKLNDLSDAEEVVQDIFADLWKRRDVIEITTSLKSYLAGAVKFQVYTTLAVRYRLKQKKEALAQNTNEQHEIPADEIYRLKVIREQLTAASNELPERCRLIYHLSREAGYSNKQIAYELHISEKTVETQITRALKHLRAVLQGIMSLL